MSRTPPEVLQASVPPTERLRPAACDRLIHMDLPPFRTCKVAAHGDRRKSKPEASPRRQPPARARSWQEDQVDSRTLPSRAVELPTRILGQPDQGLPHPSRITRARPAEQRSAPASPRCLTTWSLHFRSCPVFKTRRPRSSPSSRCTYCFQYEWLGI